MSSLWSSSIDFNCYTTNGNTKHLNRIKSYSKKQTYWSIWQAGQHHDAETGEPPP
ncbi:hypothetical protein SynA1562_01768 [Synechococcus sp. A15-62]|nr:hypothetical protein SynA1562_01768 [Synechococcus sp. A15-62]